MTTQLHSPTHRYSFRISTEASTASSMARNPGIQKQGRKILPLSETPSLILEPHEKRIIDAEKSALKSYLRVQNYWIDATIEKIVNTRFFRGRTHLQGSQAPQGWQAAHHCLAPHTVDDLTKDIIESVVDKGLTPGRSKPFLRARIELTSPDARVLQENHRDLDFVKNFILSKLPNGAENSSLYGTRFSLSRNATFENPDESNQFDTILEKAIMPLLKRLQTERFSGTIDEDTSTQELVKWLINYYETSIANNQQRLNQLDTFFALQSFLSRFEDLHSLSAEIPPEKLQEYISAVQELLKCKAALLAKVEATSRCHGVMFVRNDYYNLISLVRASASGADHATLEDLFFRSVGHFATRAENSANRLKKKYDFFIQEANAQLEGIRAYADPCTIPELKTALFGVSVDGIRIAPTESQLQEQIFSIFKIATPYKSKCRSRLFDEETLPPEPESPISHFKSYTAKRQRVLNFEEDDLLYTDSVPSPFPLLFNPSSSNKSYALNNQA